MNMKMKVKVFEVLGEDDKVIKEIIVSVLPQEEARKIAFEKLKFMYPQRYYFVELKYKGIYIR